MTLADIYRTQQVIAAFVYEAKKKKLDIKSILFDGVGKFMTVQQFIDTRIRIFPTKTEFSSTETTLNSMDRSLCYYLIRRGQKDLRERFKSDDDVLGKKL
jgi:hypothetical protein